MIKDTQFIQQLFKELTEWVDSGIITPFQKAKIEHLYTAPDKADTQKEQPALSSDAAVGKIKDNINFSRVIIGLAVLCLSVGIIIFYASNWKKMPPVFKLIQIFSVIIALYGGAYYFLQVKRNFSLIGRALLLLGIISYGTGIMLVAQVYHISAHPANGVLAWAIGAYVIAFLMAEKYSLALSMLLFVIWNMWEYSHPDNPNLLFMVPIIWGSAILIASLLLRDKSGCYLSAFVFFLWSATALTYTNVYWYAIPVAGLAIIFYLRKDQTGLIISALSFIYFYYYFTVGALDPLMVGSEKNFFMVIMHFPIAAFLITYGKIMSNHELFKSAGKIFNIVGWFSLLIPFIAISWPMDIYDIPAFKDFGVIKNLSIEYIVLSAAALAGLYFLKKRGESIMLAGPVIFFSMLVFFLPLNHTPTRMISLHLAIIGFIFLLLYYSYLLSQEKSFEKVFAFIFTIGLIVIKGFGFIILSFDDEPFKLAYLIGFILFVTVCFLINRLVHKMLSDREISYPVNILNVTCAIGAWLSVYLASFKVEQQRSIFEAQPVVIQMTVIFIVLSVILYSLLLAIIKKDRIMLYLSLIIFISSGFILLSAGPHIPWVVYSFTFNLLLFIISGVYMYYSSIIRSRALLNFAAVAIVIHIFTRYFDLFWDMFSGSLLFIITGIMGLAGGYLLERKRSDISKLIKTSGEDKENK